jgi:hypothetical protein
LLSCGIDGARGAATAGIDVTPTATLRMPDTKELRSMEVLLCRAVALLEK